MNLLPPEFTTGPADEAPHVHGVLARGPVMAALADRLLREPDEELSALRGVATPDALVVVGDGVDLPWVDGVVYLRKHPDAAGLLLPTTTRVQTPAPTLLRALLRLAPGLRPPLIALPELRSVISLADAVGLQRAWLAELVEAASG